MKSTYFLSFFKIVLLVGCLAFNAQAQPFNQFLERTDQVLAAHVDNGLVDYAALQKDSEALNTLVSSLEKFNVAELNEGERKAFWINTYNLLVIQSIVNNYPVQSPKAVRSFFEKKRHTVGSEKLSLNAIEKEKLLKPYGDGRLHFVLVCAAQGCPPILNKAYRPATLESELETAAKLILNDKQFVKLENGEQQVRISELFKWYATDFTPQGKGVIAYINSYRDKKIPEDYSLRYLDYDWTLNDKNLVNGTLNIVRYRASSLIVTGRSELKLFNSVYTQKQYDGFEKLNSRSTYYSAFAQYLYGLNPNLNIGADLVFRSSLVNDLHDASPFKALRFRNFESYATFPCSDTNHNGNCTGSDLTETDTLHNSDGSILKTSATIGLSHIGPKVKFNPIKKWSNISVQQTFYIPLQKEVDGQWISFTQIFYDQPIGRKSQLFVEASLWTPVSPDLRLDPFFKVFYSYFPTQKLTLYAMASLPAEYGLGTKYLLHPNFEVETLYTYYLPIESVVEGTRPRTFNLGFRVLF